MIQHFIRFAREIPFSSILTYDVNNLGMENDVKVKRARCETVHEPL